MRRIYSTAIPLMILGVAYIAAGMRGILGVVFAFMLYAIGDNYSRRVAAERFAEREAARATEFQIASERRKNRLLWYRRAAKDRISILLGIIGTQDAIVQVKVRDGKIQSLLIDNGGARRELFLPQPNIQPNPPNAPDDDASFFDRHNEVG